ncbi:MAG: tail fiber assembly protein [Plesiomonas sp.]
MYQWSAKHSAFFRTVDIEMKLYPDWDLSDLRPATDDEFTRFTSPSPAGKVLGTDPDGNPYWADLPPLTHEQVVLFARGEKERLLAKARETISIWQTQLQLNIISPDNKESLIKWIDYIDRLLKVDVELGEYIVWPVPPV